MTVEQVEIVNFAAIWCILKCIGRTLNDTVDTAEEGGLERVEAEALDNELALVAELHVHGMSYDGQRRRPAGDDAGGGLTEVVTFLRIFDQSGKLAPHEGTEKLITRWRRTGRRATFSGPSGTRRIWPRSWSERPGGQIDLRSAAATYWSTLKCLFSTPAWLTLIRSTAMMRSSGVRNHALAGESGNRNLGVTDESLPNTKCKKNSSRAYAPESDSNHKGDNAGDDHQPASVRASVLHGSCHKTGSRANHCHACRTSL